MGTDGRFRFGEATGAGYAPRGLLSQGGSATPGGVASELTLAVSREIASDSLEVVGGRGLCPPSLFKLGDWRDRGLQRQSTSPVRDDFVAPPVNFNQLADLKVELLDSGSHVSMVAPSMTANGRRRSLALAGWSLSFDTRPSMVGATFHECRHTFASLLIDAGVNPKAIQEFMGHATIEETFSRYGHLMPGTRDQARRVVDAYIASGSG